MQPQGRKEVRDAVAIAVLTALGTALVETGREAWQDWRKKRKKARKGKKKASARSS